MKNILNNKLLIILTLFITILFTTFSGVFANSTELTIEDNSGNNYTFYINDYIKSFNYYAVFYYKTDDYSILNILCSNSEFSYTDTSKLQTKNNDKIYYYETGLMPIHVSFETESNNISNLTDGSLTYSQYVPNTYAGTSVTLDNKLSCLYTNFDITNTNNKVVFQAAPQQVQERTLAQVVEQAQVSKTILGIKEILPVVVLVLVGLIAFWKGWQFLLKALRHS